MSGTTVPARWTADPRSGVRLGSPAQLRAGASVTYMLKAIVAISAGIAAGSVARARFGLDSTVEVSTRLVISRQFRHRIPDSHARPALRLLAVSLFALAGYVGFEPAQALVGGADPRSSPVGIAVAIALLLVPFLSW